MAAIAELLGPQLLKGPETIDSATALTCKTVGLYFSAHWCPPCRGFTPKLAESYVGSLKSKDLEIVFVSGDQDDQAFKEYYATMPWLAMPYDKAKYQAVSSKYNVAGIPTLVLLNSDGTIINTNARQMVALDPTGDGFPWVEATATAKGAARVARGMTMQVAEQTAKPVKALAGIVGAMPIASSIPGFFELGAGIVFAKKACGLNPLVCWLLGDGAYVVLSCIIGYATTKKTLELTGSTELQAYLIRKERDGATDEDMEAQIKQSQPPTSSSVCCFGVLMLWLGLYLYWTEGTEGCLAEPHTAVGWLLVIKFVYPCLAACCLAPIITAKLMSAATS